MDNTNSKSLESMVAYIVQLPEGESLLLCYDAKMGGQSPLIFPSKEVISKEVSDHVQMIADKTGYYIELREYKGTTIQVIAPENARMS